MANRTSRETGDLWEFPTRAEDSDGGLSPLFSNNDPLQDERDLQEDQEDPLELPLFQDEGQDDAINDKKTHTCSRRMKLSLAVLVVLTIFVAVPCIALAVDKRKSKQRLQASGAMQVQGVSVDVSQALPVVGVEVGILKSAFPKLTKVHPKTIECLALDADWGRVWVATIEELEAHDDARRFYINATISLPEEDADNAVNTFATVAWQVITQQRTYVGPYKCYINVQAKVAGFIQWQTSDWQRGVIDLEDVWQIRTPTPRVYANKDRPSTSASMNRPFPSSEDDENDDYTTYTVDGVVYYNGKDKSVNDFPFSSNTTVDGAKEDTSSTSAPSTVPVPERQDPSDSLTHSPTNQDHEKEVIHIPQVVETPLDGDEKEAESILVSGVQKPSAPQNYIEVLEASADGVALGIHLQMPQSILETISSIRVRLPALSLTAKMNDIQPVTQITLEEIDLNFTPETNQHFSRAEISCGDFFDPNKKCALYDPLVQFIREVLKQKNGYMVYLHVRANDSFLQRMVGPLHDIVLYRQQMTHHWHTTHLQPRRNLQEDVEVDCVLAQNSMFGNIFEFRWCMDLTLSEGIALDGGINFYGYGGSWTGDLAWERQGDILWLGGGGQLDLHLDSEEETKMDLMGSAMLDVENLKVAVYANNTAEWLPFRVVMEGSVEYLDPEDSVVFRLDKGIVDIDSEQYLDAAGEFKLNNMNEQITASLDDPRLEIAFDGRIGGDDSVVATWRVVYDGEDITTGESDFSFLTDGSGIDIMVEAEGKLATRLDGQLKGSDEEYGFDMKQALLAWGGDEKFDIVSSTMFMLRQECPYGEWSCETSLDSARALYMDRTRNHEISFGFDVEDADDSDSVNGRAFVKISNDVWMEMSMSVVVTEPDGDDKTGIELSADGQLDGQSVVLNGNGEWHSGGTQIFDLSGTSDLMVDDELLWYEYGQLSIAEDQLGLYSGFAKLETLADAAVIQLVAGVECRWYNEILECSLPEMVLEVAGTNVTDSSGDMLFDVPKSLMTLTLEDDFASDEDGYLISVSGDYTDDVLTGKLEDFKFVYDGDSVMDAVAEMKINVPDISVSYDLEETISETLIAVDRAGITIEMDEGEYDAYGSWDDELAKMILEAKNMRMVIKGEPWLHGRMEMGLDIPGSTVWMVMDNNTTKLPMDFDFIVSVEDDTVSMSMSAISSPQSSSPSQEEALLPTAAPHDDNADPLSPTMVPQDDAEDGKSEEGEPEIEDPVPGDLDTANTTATSQDDDETTDAIRVAVNASIIVFNLDGITAAFLNDPENVATLAAAFQDFVTKLLADLETDSVGRQLTGEQRRLEVSLLSDSAIVYGVDDIDCPINGTQAIPPNATCQAITGGYELVVLDEDPDDVSEKYVEMTDVAIKDGRLQDSLVAQDPDFPAVVYEAIVQGVVREAQPDNTGNITATPQSETSSVSPSPSPTPIVLSDETQAPSAGIGRGLAIAWLSFCVSSCLMC